jgi:leucyl-tRNA synthetase
MVLCDLGHLDFDEPFAKFRAHGLIVKDGSKMSKSRGNVVIPDQYIAKWGADTFRLYLMFLGPFQEGGDFRDEGISGPRRFLDRVWTMVGEAVESSAEVSAATRSVLVKWNQTKHQVTQNIEGLKYNTAIAALMELVNTLRDQPETYRDIVADLILMLAPFCPHFAEECWERLGRESSIFDASWPSWDVNLLVESEMEIVIQVNGKTRSRVSVPWDAAEEAVMEAVLADPTTRRFLEGKEIRKRIYVPGRLVNLVVGS